jgi:hypothetical protein
LGGYVRVKTNVEIRRMKYRKHNASSGILRIWDIYEHIKEPKSDIHELFGDTSIMCKKEIKKWMLKHFKNQLMMSY